MIFDTWYYSSVIGEEYARDPDKAARRKFNDLRPGEVYHINIQTCHTYTMID